MIGLEKQYYNLLKDVLNNGDEKSSQKSTIDKTISSFGYNLSFNLNNGFPVPITKSVYWKGIVFELLWFLSGSNRLSDLIDKTKIWNNDAYNYFLKCGGYLNKDNFIKSVKSGNIDGDMGKIYGYQWRNFDGQLDQLVEVVYNIINNPNSRRHLITAWNPVDIPNQALPACHSFFQFNVSNNNIDLQFYLRSSDLFLGLPFNIASYALLLHIISKITNYNPRWLIVSIGDAHIYNNQIEAVKEQLQRYEDYIFYGKDNWNDVSLPELKFSQKFENISQNLNEYSNNEKNNLEYFFNNMLLNLNEKDFILKNYKSMSAIKAPLNT